MAIKAIDDSTLTGIANAIRALNESQNTYTPAQMATEIASWSVIPTYTVYFYNGSTLLQTAQRVPARTSAQYTGQTPTKTGVANPEKYRFIGWSPSPDNITQDTSCYAQFEYDGVLVEEIQDDWSTIISRIENGYADYVVGMYKPLNLGTAQGTVNMQIVAKRANASPLASGNGNAMYDFISINLRQEARYMNPNRNGKSGNYGEGTGTIGGWEKCSMRSYLKNTIKPLIPAIVRDAIKDVTKYSKTCNTSGAFVNDVASVEDLWLPSAREVFGGTSYETQGPIYNDVFKNAASRTKKLYSTDTKWALRSASSSSSFACVTDSGSVGTHTPVDSIYAPLCFSLGEYLS